MSSVNIGIVGCGTVGTEVCDLLLRSPALLENRIGVGVNIVKVAVRTLAKSRKCNLHLQTLTTSWEEVVSHPDVQLVVELIGGITVAREVVTAALKRGLPVVTANKALISAHGKDLIAHAEKNQANIYFEASVAGGIPIIKALREGMIANQIEYLYGILNGTCNYILTEMTQAGIGLDKALDQATKNGFAEADPSLDVEGMDSAHKIGILASLAHGFWIRPEEVHVEGIAHLRRDEMGEMLRNKRDHVILADGINHLDIKYAHQMGYAIKLLAVMKNCGPNGDEASRIQAAVYPALVPHSHVLASVSGSFNAVLLKGSVIGECLLYGKGAGGLPTASAVISDIADAALDIRGNMKLRIPPFPQHSAVNVRPFGETVNRYYVRMAVKRKPGTLADITAVLKDANIGIRSVVLNEKTDKGYPQGFTTLILMLHTATNASLDAALEKISELEIVGEPMIRIRVEDFE